MKRIIFVCLRGCLLTGSELYAYTLLDAIQEKYEYSVTLAATEISPYFVEKCRAKNIECKHLSNIDLSDYDIMLLSHYKEVEKFIDINSFEGVIVNICHSEIYPSELPMVSDRVNKYIAIRPSIKDKITQCGVRPDRVEVIYNPIDLSRFNTDNCSNQGYGLWMGTWGGLRQQAAQHFVSMCKSLNLKTKYVSAENFNPGIFDECGGATENPEELIRSADWVGGIIHGRSFYESRLMGKKTVEYIIDIVNNCVKVVDIELLDEPTEPELEMYKDMVDKYKVAQRVLDCVK